VNNSEASLSTESALLVAYYFPPINVIAAQRALRIARVLLKRFACVYVIRLAPDGLDPAVLDYEYGRDVLENPRIKFLDAKPLLDRRGFSARPSMIHKVIGGVFTRLFCDPGLDWLPAIFMCLRGLRNPEQFAAVVASGPPFVPLVPVIRWAARHNIPVVLDYRDLWTQHPAAPFPRLARFLVNHFLERPINRIATLITTVSRGCREMLLRNSPQASIQILLNAPDKDYKQYFSTLATNFKRPVCENRQNFRIVFTGQVYAHCTFAPLLAAMLRMPSELLEQVEVHYYGGCSESVAQEFNHFGLGRCLSDHGRVSKEDSIGAILGADLLLSLIHTERVASNPSISGLMTTKVYDYFLSGNPILSVGPVNADVNFFAEALEYSDFISFSADETEMMSNFLIKKMTEKNGTKEPFATVNMPDFASDLEHILGMLVKN
jgi:hypothetical protein